MQTRKCEPLSSVSSVCFSQTVTLSLQVEDEDDLDTRDQTDDDDEEDEDEDQRKSVKGEKGEKRLCRNAPEKLSRTKIWKQFLVRAAMLSSSLLQHMYALVFGHFQFKMTRFFPKTQFSATAERFKHVSVFISAAFTISL